MAPTLKYLVLCSLAVVLACTDEHRTPNPIVPALMSTEVDDRMHDGKLVQREDSAIRLSCPSELMISIGALQRVGSRPQDLYVFGKCMPKDGLGLDIIWIPELAGNNVLTADELIAKYRDSKCLSRSTNLTRSGFRTTVFDLPLKEVKDPLLDDPYKFPCIVVTYVSEGEELKLLSKTRVGSWESYVELQASVLARSR